MRMVFLRAIEFQLDWSVIIPHFAECVKFLVIGHLLLWRKTPITGHDRWKNGREQVLESKYFQFLRDRFVQLKTKQPKTPIGVKNRTCHGETNACRSFL